MLRIGTVETLLGRDLGPLVGTRTSTLSKEGFLTYTIKCINTVTSVSDFPIDTMTVTVVVV